MWLAIATAADAQISGAWIIEVLRAVILALGTAGAAWIGAMRWMAKKQEKREAEAAKVSLHEPVPEVPVKRVYSPPTFYQHRELERRLGILEAAHEAFSREAREEFAEIRRESHESFVKLLNAGHERGDRLLEKIDGVARGIHARVDELLKNQPPTKKP